MATFPRRDVSQFADSLASYLPGDELFAAARAGGTNLRKLIEGLAAELSRVNEAIGVYSSDVIPDEVYYLLDEWESAVGIPDSCFLGDGSVDERRRDVLLKLASLGVQTVEEFTLLASVLGLSVTVTPAAPYAIFPMKLPILLTPSDKAARFTILVEHTQDSTTTFPLVFPVTFGDPALQKLECVLSKLKPANCALIFRQVA